VKLRLIIGNSFSSLNPLLRFSVIHEEKGFYSEVNYVGIKAIPHDRSEFVPFQTCSIDKKSAIALRDLLVTYLNGEAE
jgi:hypothetical protein